LPDLEGQVAVEPVEEVTTSETVDDTSDQVEDEAPSEEPSEDVESTESSEPDDSDGNDDDAGDEPVITRRNAKAIAKEAKAIADQAIRDYEAERQRNEDLQKQLADSQKSEEALTEEMTSFIGADEEYKRLLAVLNEPLPIADDEFDLDAVQAQRAAVKAQNDAKNRLAEMNNRRELLPKMLGRVRSSFASSVYEVFDAVANDAEGVDRATFVDHLMAEGLEPAEVKVRLRKAFDHLYSAGKATGANEWKGRYEAEKRAHNVTKASAGGPSASPESSGRGSSSGGLDPDQWMAMSAQERIDLRSTPEGRAKIDAMTRGMSGR
jgi:hypothetical protein